MMPQALLEINLDADWSKNGRVFIRQVDPLPLAVLSVIPRVLILVVSI